MKKIWKRSLSLFLAMVMVFGMLPVRAFADETEPVTTEETSVTEPAAAAEIPAEETTAPVTEAPVVETTVPATEAPVVETTVPVTEAPEVETTVPVTEAPVVETTAPEVQVQELPMDKVSQEAANSAAEATTVPDETESEEAEPVIQQLPMISSKATQSVPGNDELFAAYADHVWFGTDIAMFGTAGGDRLDPDTRLVYNALVGFIKQLASGERTNGMIKVGANFGEGYVPDAEIYPDWSNFDLTAMTNALLADLPYELYWFNKAIFQDGISATYEDGTVDYQYYFYFSVASQYNSGDYKTFTYQTIDPSTEEVITVSEDVCYFTSGDKIATVQNTLTNAQKVVDDIALTAETDYDKLLAYKDWICDNTEYNQDVKYNGLKFETNCDPWQVIYVFDGKSETTVVCEGYSKAFQLLCDLTEFSRDSNNLENVTCYSVTGSLPNPDDPDNPLLHMWNIVEIEGNNYLADITDCEPGTIGEDGSLFLAGAAPDDDSGTSYTFYNTGNQSITFVYDDAAIELWGSNDAPSGILVLSESSYEVPKAEGMTQAELEAALAEAVENKTSYTLEESVTLTDDLTISIPNGAPFQIPEGVTLTVSSEKTLTVSGNILISGNLVLNENATLAMVSTIGWSNIYLNGGSLTVGSTAQITYDANSLIVADTSSGYTITGSVPADILAGRFFVSTEAELQNALTTSGFCKRDIQLQQDFAVTQDITLQATDYITAADGLTLTIDSGATVTNNGSISIYMGTLNNNGTIVNNGKIEGVGTYTGSGTITVNPHTIQPITGTSMTQAEFEQALKNSSGFLSLKSEVVIESEFEIPDGYTVFVASNGSLTVAEGAVLTVNGQLSGDGGDITINGTLVNNSSLGITYSGTDTALTVSESGVLENNCSIDICSGTFSVLGTYEDNADGDEEINGAVTWDRLNAEIIGIEKLNPDRISIRIIVNTEEQLIAALAPIEDPSDYDILINADITLNTSQTIPENAVLTVGYAYDNEGAQYQYGLTLADGVTLTNNGVLRIESRMYLTISSGAAVINNRDFSVDGRLDLNGSVEGNDIQVSDIGVVVVPEMSQADFEAAVAAAGNGEVYYLNSNVTLTSDATITSEVRVGKYASLTVDGCKLTVGNVHTDDYDQYGHLIADGGTITVQSDATLDIHTDALMQVWGGGTLNLDTGANLEGVDAAEIWYNVTIPGENTVNGLPDSMLGAIFNPKDALGIEEAFAKTDYYAFIGVYPCPENNVLELDRNIIIPDDDNLNLLNQVTVIVPAGCTLTNNGIIDICADNRLEILKNGTLVNNDTINVDPNGEFVVRGTFTDNGTVNGDIISGKMSHETLMNSLVEGSSWSHEFETTLDPNVNNGILEISLGSGDPSPQFYLENSGIIIVPAGTRLEVYNPLIVKEGAKVIVEEGGTLYVNGTLSVEGGTVYIAEGGSLDDSGENCDISGKITWEGDTATYLSETWLDNQHDTGWYWPEENELHEAGGLQTMDCHWRIYFLNTWDAENLVWNVVPVIPTENNSYMTITRIAEMPETTILEGEEYAEYYVCVDVTGTLEDQEAYLFVDDMSFRYDVLERVVGFYTQPEISLENFIDGHHYQLSTEDGGNVIYWMLKDPGDYKIVEDSFKVTLNTWGQDYTEFTGGEDLVDVDYSQKTEGIYKFTIHPDYVKHAQYEWKNFDLAVDVQLNPVNDDENDIQDWYWSVWIDAPERPDPKVALEIDYENYYIYEADVIYKDTLGEDGWYQTPTDLPAGVGYEPKENKVILTGDTSLKHLGLHHGGTLNLAVYGENSVSNDSDCALRISNGTQVTVTGSGTLNLYAKNSSTNTEEGIRYAFPTVALNGGSSLTIGSSVNITAQVDGSGFHGDYPARMEAISGHNESSDAGDNSMTLSENAVLTIVTPEGTRTLDESQQNYGGARGIVNVSIEVNDNATLNTGSIYLWEGVDFTMNGGTVNLEPLGEVFLHPRQEDYYISRLGIYLEDEGSVFTLNDGIINIDAVPDEADYDNYCLTIFQGINASIGDVNINGGEINIFGDGNDSGSGISVQCAWDDNGPVAGLPTGNLYITDGTVNVNGPDNTEYEGIYTSALSEAVFSGGTVNAYGGLHYLEGNVDWTGNMTLNGNIQIVDGSRVTVKNGAAMTIYQDTTVEQGGKIIVENGGSLHVSGYLTVDGTVYIRNGGGFDTDPGDHVKGRITWEGYTATYLSETWLDNEDNTGWYWPEGNELHEAGGLHAMDCHWRIYFVNTWDAENLVWNSVPVIPTSNSSNITITPIANMENETIRDGEEYASFYVCVDVSGTLDNQQASLSANGITFPYEIYERVVGFYTQPEISMENYIDGHHYQLSTEDGGNVIYWMLRNPDQYETLTEDDVTVTLNTWGQDYTEFTNGYPLISEDLSQLSEGIIKFTVNPKYVDYVQYNWKNFELSVIANLDSINDESDSRDWEWTVWIDAPERPEPVARMGINNDRYQFLENGTALREYFNGQDWVLEPTDLPGLSYTWNEESGESKLTLNNVTDLVSLDLRYSDSWTDENGDHYEQLLRSKDLIIVLEGENSIINHCNSAVTISNETNVTITGDGSLHAKTTNYTDVPNAYNTIHVQNGSSLTIGGNATVTAELGGHGYWEDGEAATCHPISGSYSGEILEITDNATLTTVLPNGVRRYDNSGTTSQIGGYVGIQNFNTVTVSGGTLNTDHLNFWNGGEFNLTGGTANFKDIGSIDKYTTEEGQEIVESHYEAINMIEGTVNISGGELNIDVSAREDETVDRAGFYGINVVEGALNIEGGTINIDATTDGVAILADCRYDENNNPVEGTGSYLNVTGGTININVPGKVYHGGIIVDLYGEAYFSGGKITDDYGVYRFYGETLWDGEAELNGLATNVYTHDSANFYMSGGSFNLTGDSYEENGETICNRAIFETNGGGSIYGGEINLTNGTYINNMNLSIDGGKITVENDWPEVPGLENHADFVTTGGTMDITANGIAIKNTGTFQQMGGEITARNTSGSKPVMTSEATVMLTNGTMNLHGNGGGVGLYELYNANVADPMVFIGAADDASVPYLNISDVKVGIYAKGPALISSGANVDIQVKGKPVNENRDWPMAIYIEEFIDDASGENVSMLVIDGGTNVNLVSQDTENVAEMSKGIVSWYSPVAIGTETAPNLTIDAEMALYSMTDSAENNNLFINGEIRSLTTEKVLDISGSEFAEGEYLYTVMEDGSYAGKISIAQSTSVTNLEELKGHMTYHEDSGRWSLEKTVYVEGSFALEDIVIDVINGGTLYVAEGVTLTVNKTSHLVAQERGTIQVNGQIVNNGIMAADRGSITFADDENGYVAASDFAVLNVHYYNGVLSPVTGVPYARQTLKTVCATVDQMYNILGMEHRSEYGRVEIHITDDLELITTTVPVNVTLTAAPDITITVPEGTFLTVEGAVNIRNSDLIVDGTLINNAGLQGGVTFNLSEVTVNGRFDNNGPAFINDGSVMTVNGSLNNRFALHVGYWRDANTASPAGTLNIAEGAVLMNADYLLVSPDAQIAEEDGSIRHCGGVVNVMAGGVLENSADAEAQTTGFIEQRGEMNVYGVLAFTDGSMALYGTLTVEPNGQVSLGRSGKIDVLEDGSLVNNGYFGLECGTVNGNIDNRGSVSVTWIESNVGKVNGEFINGADRVDLYMPFNSVAPNHDEAAIQDMLTYANSNGINRITVHFTNNYDFADSFTVPQNMSFIVGAYRNDDEFSGTTVTFPAGTMLTIDGSVQVAKKSALVINGDIARNGTGSFYASGTCSDNITWELNNGVLTIDGTGDMLDYAENSAPWADYASLITSVKFGDGITGISPEMTVIAELDANVQNNKPVSVVTAMAEGTDETIATAFVDSSIVGAALNAAEDATEVKLVIGNPSGENTISDGYTGTLFSMTLDGVADASALEVPVKVTLSVPATITNPEALSVLHYHDGEEEVLTSTVFQENDAWYVSFVVDGFSDFAIVEEAEEEVFNYTFLQSTQLGLIEPWFLKSNLYMKNADGKFLTEAELNSFKDFGVYFIRASELENPDAEPTVEDIINNPNTILYSKNHETHKAVIEKGSAGYMITASYVEGIYTYELQDPVYVLFYVDTASARHYDVIKNRNLYTIANQGKTNTSFQETERAVYARMVELENAIAIHRATFESIPDMAEQKAPLITAGQFGNYQTGYAVNHSVNIVLIEPWGIKLNGYVDKNAVLEDAGVVVFYDKEDQYAVAPTVDELLSNTGTYVFSNENGNASVSVSGNYKKIEATYNKGIYTYQLNDNAYAAVFVKVNGVYHFSEVKTRNILSIIESLQDNTNFLETERGVYKAMINMHNDVVTHRAKFDLS